VLRATECALSARHRREGWRSSPDGRSCTFAKARRGFENTSRAESDDSEPSAESTFVSRLRAISLDYLATWPNGRAFSKCVIFVIDLIGQVSKRIRSTSVDLNLFHRRSTDGTHDHALDLLHFWQLLDATWRANLFASKIPDN
jgi:hypothetical protein